METTGDEDGRGAWREIARGKALERDAARPRASLGVDRDETEVGLARAEAHSVGDCGSTVRVERQAGGSVRVGALSPTDPQELPPACERDPLPAGVLRQDGDRPTTLHGDPGEVDPGTGEVRDAGRTPAV